MTKYAKSPGSRARGSAQAIGEELHRIRDKFGHLTPKAVVNESRPEESPLHPSFEWDDSVAGELYRESQARHIIKDITVVRLDEDDPTKKVFIPVYANVPSEGDEQTHYQSIEVLKQPESERQRARAYGLLVDKLNAANNAVEEFSLAISASPEEYATLEKITAALRQARKLTLELSH